MPPLALRAMPRYPGILALLGPGIVWLALSQGSGELIWWPYLVAKYGLTFLCLLIPSCLLQFPLNYAVGQYTMLTGESIFQGFMRINRWYAFGLWVLLIVHFLWFGAFASAGATALVELSHFPPGLERSGQRLFWAYLAIGVFFIAVLFSRVIYKFLERLMWVVAIVSTVGLLLACLHPVVIGSIGAFLKGMVSPPPLARPWEPKDALQLLTAVTFAGLGGFWLLFYSYWLREKNVGMAKHFGHITGPITGHPEVIPRSGFLPEPEAESIDQTRRWKRHLIFDSGIGIGGNILTTLMTCLLAFAVLLPKGIWPEGEQLAVVQAEFFGAAWGQWGRAIFLLIAASFLADTWLVTADGVARIHTDFVLNYFPGAERWSPSRWYLFFFVLLTLLTSITMPLAQPGSLILMNAIIGIIATVAYSVGLILLNFKLRRLAGPAIGPTRRSTALLIFVALVYLGLAIAYIMARL